MTPTPLTPNFSLEEFRCKDGTPYPAEWVNDRLMPLCVILELVRAAFGSPLTIVSGYRTPAHNVSVGGAGKSQHMEGRAADIKPAGGLGSSLLAQRVSDLHALILRMYQEEKLPGLGGLGIYPGWVHVDVRPGTRLARWAGTRVGDG